VETKICIKCQEVKPIEEFSFSNKIKKLRINECRECKKKYLKQYHEKNDETLKQKKKLYREKNSEQFKYRKKKYYLENKEKIREYKREWERKRRNDGSLFKFKQLIRHRINVFFKTRKITKKNKTFDIIGCSPEFLKEYIEKQFKEGMTWDNYGIYGWHIDHIIPLSSAKDEDEMYKLCHYTNLQPLWTQENLSKGDRIL